jgi:RimJ/RimL family protein N-acetyltransferase
MTLSRIEILNKINKLKHEDFAKIVINCNFNNFQYNLMLLTADCAHNRNLMELIGSWRKKNEMWFLSQFKVTTERTTKWFEERVIGTPDRLLFIINANEKYIGHVGLFRFDFENKTCEIDNIVRGEPDYPGIMGNAVLCMMKWGENKLDIKNYSLKVLSDNEKARRLYERLGFIEISRIPLIPVMGKDGLEWVEAPDGYDKGINKYYIVMKLVKNNKNRLDFHSL